MAELDVDLIPDFDELENRLDDEELTKEVSVDGGGAAGGAGGGGDGGLLATLGLEAGTDIASGAGKGGALGKVAGGLSSAVLLLGSIVGFLALLEPIQQAIGFLVRQFELFVVPFVSALRPVLELVQKAVVRIVQFLRNPGEFFSGLINTVKQALAPLVNGIIRTINREISNLQSGIDSVINDLIDAVNGIPGVNVEQGSGQESGAGGGSGSGRILKPIDTSQISTRGPEFESVGETNQADSALSTLVDIGAEVGAEAATQGNPALVGLSNTLLSDDATNEALFNLAGSVLGGGRNY